MAKEVAIGKRAKISQAQEYMILSVLGASLILGAAISAIIHFTQQISFNTKVIMAEDQSITAYSNIIKSTGICEAPSGSTYTEDELSRCNPDSIEISKIPGTLRYNVLNNLAANAALNSVPKEDNLADCRDQINGKQYTYKDLMQLYNRASTSEQLIVASQRIRRCSALRVIPDALPAFKNEEALLASLNKLFIVSGWQPESLSPTGTATASETIPGLYGISVRLSIDADAGTTTRVLDNIERSIREFDIERATIEWKGNDTLGLQAQATAYYMDESTITETTETIKAEGK